MDSSPNFDNIIYHYICENPNLFKIVDTSFFRNIYIQRLYALTASYYKNFGTIPFNINSPSTSTIKEIAYLNIKRVITDNTISKEDNLDIFVRNAEHIIVNTDYKKWDKKFLQKTIDAWVELSNMEKGIVLASEHLKIGGERTPENIPRLLMGAKEILNRRGNIIIHDEISESFLDPRAHQQIDPVDLINTGFKNLNMWLSGSYSGGLEPGTSTILVGESNIGKSIWLGCLAYNMFLNGKNVLVISLEMAINKLYKRIGSNAFDVDVNNYAGVSNDLGLMTDTIKEFKTKHGTELLPPGNLYGIKFTNASVKDIEIFAQREAKRLGLNWHAIIIDYFTELDNSRGTPADNMYLYHKQNSSDLFKMAGDNYWASLTAHQIKGADYGADDLTLLSLGESRGINHRTDNVIGIIQNPTMRHENRFYLKNMKTRDGAWKNYKSAYDIDFNHMRLLEQDEMIQPTDMIISSA